MPKITTSVSDGVTFRKAEGSLNAAKILDAIRKHSPTLETSRVVWDFTNAYAHRLISADLKEIADSALVTNAHRPSDDKAAIIFASELEFYLGKQLGNYLKTNRPINWESLKTCMTP